MADASDDPGYYEIFFWLSCFWEVNYVQQSSHRVFVGLGTPAFEPLCLQICIDHKVGGLVYVDTLNTLFDSPFRVSLVSNFLSAPPSLFSVLGRASSHFLWVYTLCVLSMAYRKTSSFLLTGFQCFPLSSPILLLGYFIHSYRFPFGLLTVGFLECLLIDIFHQRLESDSSTALVPTHHCIGRCSLLAHIQSCPPENSVAYGMNQYKPRYPNYDLVYSIDNMISGEEILIKDAVRVAEFNQSQQ